MNRESKQGTERFLKHAMASFGLALMALILPGSLSAEYLCNYEDVSVDPTDSYFACFWGCRADLWNNLACTAPHQANWCARYCADAEADVCEGNPIQLSSGAKLHAETDYQGVGEYPLTLRRYYSTAWTMPEGHWGEKWLGSDFARLVSVHTDTEGDIYTAVRPNGRHIKFTWVANGGGTTRALKASTEETLTLYNYEDGYIWVLRLSDGTQEVYDFDLQVFTDEQRFSSKLLWSKQHGGVHHTYGYDAEDRLETITHSNGQQLRFFYNADDRIERVAAPGELSYSYRYDDVGNLIGVTYPGRASEAANDTASKTYLYEDPRHPHHLTGILDEGGQRFAHYAYDAEGRTVLSEHGDGGERVEVLAYGDNVRTRNALGKESVYHFGTAGSDAGMMRQLMSVEGEASASCAASNSRYRYDDNGFKDLIQGENGLYTDLDYNGQGQLIRRVGPLRMQGERLESLGETQVVETDWVAPPALNMPLERREPGKTTRYSYEHDRIATLTETDTTDHTLPYSTNGNTRSWTNRYTYYDVDGRRIETITIDGPLPGEQESTQYAFDDLGNLSRQTNALGHVVSYSDYTPLGHPGRITDANGLVIELDYNALGLLRETRSLSQQGAATTRYAYYPNRQISRITLTDGSYLSFEYNAARHLTAIENDLGERIEYTPSPLDGQWRDQLVRAGDGAITRTRQRVFDELGRVIRLLGANTQRSDYQYDPAGNRIAETRQGDGAQAETLFAYDGLKRLTTLTDPLQSLVEFGYDPQGNLDALTDPLGNTTHYVYDGFGNLIQQTSPDTGVTSYTYDDAGNRISQTDARNITVSYEYDLLNRLTGIHYPDSALDRTYRYDEGVNGIGRLVGMSDAEGVSEYVYNDTGALVRQIRTSRDGITTRFEYAYDAQGRLVSQTYPSGYVLKFSYLQGRLSGLSLQRPDGAIQPITTHLSYLPFGPLQSLDYGNGLSLSRSFDQDYRLTDQVIQGLLESRYTYDPMDNLRQWEDLLDPDQDQRFDYDLLNRLTRATQGEDSGISYTYDALGNRLSRTTWTARGLMSATTVLPEYDAVGNAVRDARGSYRYDDTNRLVGFNSGDTEAGYGYNGRGERVRKTLDGEITRFRYGPSGELFGEYNESGQPIREYLYQDGQPVAILSANQLVYLHTDHLGSVIKASDESGALVWSARRDPFGKRWISMAQVEMPLGYPGQYYDQESGNFYNYFRDYDPTTGRYLQSDPIGLAGGLNTYAYVGGNPLRYTDPTGEFAGVLVNPATLGAIGIAAIYVYMHPDAVRGLLDALHNESADDCEPIETPIDDLDPLHSPDTIGDRPDLEGLSDQDLLDSVRNPNNGDPLRQNTRTGKLMDGNSRAHELKNRANNPSSSISGGDTVPVVPYTPDLSDFWDL